MGQMMARSWLAGLIAAVAVAGCAPLPAPGTAPDPRVHGVEARRRAADAAHLPLEAAPQALALADLVELELDRGTAGVQDKDGLAHAGAPVSSRRADRKATTSMSALTPS